MNKAITDRWEYQEDKPGTNQLIHFDLPMAIASSHRIYAGRVIEWAAPRPPEMRENHSFSDIVLLKLVTDEAAGYLPLPEHFRMYRPEHFKIFSEGELRRRTLHSYGYPRSDGAYASGYIHGRGPSGLLHFVAKDDHGDFIAPGFSGAPVLDERRQQILGMVVSLHPDEAKRLAFVVPTHLIRRACPTLAQPYRGLKAFESDDAEFFFGRQEFVEAMLAKADRHPILGVTAASGAGKSSAIRAGLLPKFKAMHNCIVLVIRPEDDPWKQLAEALAPLLYPSDSPGDSVERARKIAQEVKSEPSILVDYARTLLKQEHSNRILIVLDQFEELFTLAGHEPQDSSAAGIESRSNQDFRDLMVATAGLDGHAGKPKLQWLYALRGDFADRAFRHRPFRDAVGEGNEFLADMTGMELREAIEKPAAELGVSFEGGTVTHPGLVERIAMDAGATVGALPLMQHVLEKLWEGMQERKLTHGAYQELGEVKGALDRHADTVFDALSTEMRKLVPRLFSRLVNVKEDGEAIRRMARRRELGEALWSVAIQLATEVRRPNREVLESRLLILSGLSVAPFRNDNGRTDDGADTAPSAQLFAGPGPGEAAMNETVEVAHEALLRHWGKLKDWVREDQRFILWRQRLNERLRDHLESGSRDDTLLVGGMLAQAQSWLETRPDDLNDIELRFIEASSTKRKEKDEYEKRRKEELEAALEHLKNALEAERNALRAETEARSSAEYHRSTAEAAEETARRLLSSTRKFALAASTLALLACGGFGLAILFYGRAEAERKSAESANSKLNDQLRISLLERKVSLQFSIAQDIFSRLAVACVPQSLSPLKDRAQRIASNLAALQREPPCDRLVNVANSASIWLGSPRRAAGAFRIEHPEMQRFIQAVKLGEDYNIFREMRARKEAFDIPFRPTALIDDLKDLSFAIKAAESNQNNTSEDAVNSSSGTTEGFR